MWQPLLRNWILGQAQQKMRSAAMQAATEAAGAAQPAEEGKPPKREPDVCHVGVVFALGIEAGGLADLLQGVVRTQGAGFSAPKADSKAAAWSSSSRVSAPRRPSERPRP